MVVYSSVVPFRFVNDVQSLVVNSQSLYGVSLLSFIQSPKNTRHSRHGDSLYSTQGTQPHPQRIKRGSSRPPLCLHTPDKSVCRHCSRDHHRTRQSTHITARDSRDCGIDAAQPMYTQIYKTALAISFDHVKTDYAQRTPRPRIRAAGALRCYRTSLTGTSSWSQSAASYWSSVAPR